MFEGHKKCEHEKIIKFEKYKIFKKKMQT